MKLFLQNLLSLAFVAFVLFTPIPASANTCDDLRTQFEQHGGGNTVGPLPKYCTVGEVYTRIINIALASVGVAAVGAGVYGGYLYMISQGDQKNAARGKTILLYAAVGVAVVLGAAALVNIVVQLAVNNTL